MLQAPGCRLQRAGSRLQAPRVDSDVDVDVGAYVNANVNVDTSPGRKFVALSGVAMLVWRLRRRCGWGCCAPPSPLDSSTGGSGDRGGGIHPSYQFNSINLFWRYNSSAPFFTRENIHPLARTWTPRRECKCDETFVLAVYVCICICRCTCRCGC